MRAGRFPAAGPFAFAKAATLLAVLVCSVLVAGCGGQDAQSDSAAAQPVAYVSGGAPSIERQLGNTFRAALDRLAVMSQTTDDAADMGQQLPAGTLEGMNCEPNGPKPSGGIWKWSCSADSKSVNGKAKRIKYRVQVTGKGCIYAQADPAMRQIPDATIHAPAENPLSSLVVPIKGC